MFHSPSRRFCSANSWIATNECLYALCGCEWRSFRQVIRAERVNGKGATESASDFHQFVKREVAGKLYKAQLGASDEYAIRDA